MCSVHKLCAKSVRRLREGVSVSPQLTVKKSKIYGRGCFALAHFPARKKIADYAGEQIRGSRKIQARIRRQDAIKVIQIGDDAAVDGAVGGNETAYINHSCDPNAFMRVMPGEKVAIFARRDIRPGDELTINYRDPNHPVVCKCGADNCRSKRRRRDE
jgi:uncharacterized protein